MDSEAVFIKPNQLKIIPQTIVSSPTFYPDSGLRHSFTSKLFHFKILAVVMLGHGSVTPSSSIFHLLPCSIESFRFHKIHCFVNCFTSPHPRAGPSKYNILKYQMMMLRVSAAPVRQSYAAPGLHEAGVGGREVEV